MLRNPGEQDIRPRAVVPRQRVNVGPQATRVVVPGCQSDHEPQIQVITNSERIEAIEVTCGCGRRIRLVCQYDEST